MSKTKLFTTLLLAMVVLFAQVGTVAAAPQAQDITSITGTIQSITTDTDVDGNTIVLVTLEDALGATQTLQFSLEDATDLGLVTVNPDTNEVTVDETLVGTQGNFDPDLATLIEEPVEESNHPISVILAAFFGEDASVIDAYHEDGYGFGVIAQAFWMSQNYGGDASLTSVILEAKTTGDYSAITLPDGSTPTNWGQFKKALSDKKNNLGVVVSGKADKDQTEDVATVEQSQPGNGKDKNNDKSNNGKDKSKDKGKGKDN
jgi:hypothetical protein